MEKARKTFIAATDLQPHRRIKITDATTKPQTVGYAEENESAIAYTEVFVAAGTRFAPVMANSEGSVSVSSTGAITGGEAVYGAANGQVAGAGSLRQGVALETVTNENDVLAILSTMADVGLDAINGTLDGYVRAHHVSCLQRTPATAPTVTFIQDDGTADAYTKLKPFLETNSLAMTLAIPTRNIGDAGYLTLAQLTEMHDDDLITTASHGIDWNESDMDDLTEAQLHAVYSESQDWLTTHGFEGDVFVAPHHQMDRLARQVCARYFRACRANEKASTVDGHGIIRSPIQTFNLPCHLLSTTDLDASDITDAQAAIDEMVSLWDSGDGYATWILFTIHTVDDTRIASLQSLVDYIDSKSVFQYKTFQDGLDLFENYADFGEMGDSLCECVHISPWGDIGCRELDTHSMIRVWSPASPWYKYHSIEFKEGGIYDDDLLLTAKPDGSGSVTVRCDALIPYLGEADLGHRDDGRWDDVITEQLSVMSNHRSAYAIKHKYLNNQSLSGASTDITTGLPDPHLLLGVAYRVRTAIEGATSWDGDFLGGATEKFADDAGLTQNTKGEFIMAPAKVTGTNNIRITANGSNFTAGVIDLTVYYIEIDEMDDV